MTWQERYQAIKAIGQPVTVEMVEPDQFVCYVRNVEIIDPYNSKKPPEWYAGSGPTPAKAINNWWKLHVNKLAHKRLQVYGNTPHEYRIWWNTAKKKWYKFDKGMVVQL